MSSGIWAVLLLASLHNAHATQPAASAMAERLAEITGAKRTRDGAIFARRLPKRARLAHEQVVRNISEETCAERLSVLRALVDEGEHEAVLDLSFALDDLRSMSAVPESCRLDEPFVGVADITVEMKTPRDRTAPTARSRRVTEAHLRGVDGKVTHHG